jgi:hypothetical protein
LISLLPVHSRLDLMTYSQQDLMRHVCCAYHVTL